MENRIILRRRKVLYGAVIAAVVFGMVVIFGASKKDSADVAPPVVSSNQNVSTTTLALIEHNRNALKLFTGSSSVAEETAHWQEFTNQEAGFSIRYPKDLIQMRYGEGYPFQVNTKGLFFERPIPFETYDTCNGKGDEPPLTEIPDFELGIRVAMYPFREAVGEDNDYTGDKLDALVTRIMYPEGMDGVNNIGPFKGFARFIGSEYCGFDTYYVPLDVAITLIVKEPILLDSLYPSLYSKKRYEDAQSRDPRVKAYAQAQSRYSPIDRDKLAYQILSTFKLLDK